MRGASFYDLIRSQQQRRRGSEAESLRGLDVDDQLILGGLLHGYIGGLGTFQNLVHEACRSAEQVRIARRIGHEPTCLHHLPVWVHGRQPTLLCELHDSYSFSEEKAVR